MDDKFNRVMDHGTPRLVTKSRQLVMDQTQLRSKAFLQNLANERKGANPLNFEDKKEGFSQFTVANFREKMLKEEKEQCQSQERQTFQKNNQNQKQEPPISSNFFQKLKNTTEEEAKMRINLKKMPI